MTLPTRLVQAVRPQASPGVMAGAAVVAAVFAATPFLLPDVAGRLGVDIGRTGLISTAQVGSFALASFLAGRLFHPRRRLHYGSLALVAVANIASAFAPTFTLLLAARLVAGFGLGTLTWIAWSDATRFPRGIGEVAAVAPLAAMVGSPIIGWLVDVGGYRMVFLGLAALTVITLPLRVDFGQLPRIGRRVSSSRSNRFLLSSLLAISLGGSAVFIFAGALAISSYGLDSVTMSWALSLNAITGVVATRFSAKPNTAGLWLLATAGSALVVGLAASPWVFFAAMAAWGFAFWMAVPAVFQLLAARSDVPSERVGDAQAAMAIGRVFGPIVGGLALGIGQFGRLSVVGAAVIATGAISVSIVEVVRHRLYGSDHHRAARG